MKDARHHRPGTSDESAQKARREFLRRAGSLAAYTPPLMLALMYPSTEAVASGGQTTGGGTDPSETFCSLSPRLRFPVCSSGFDS